MVEAKKKYVFPRTVPQYTILVISHLMNWGFLTYASHEDNHCPATIWAAWRKAALSMTAHLPTPCA